MKSSRRDIFLISQTAGDREPQPLRNFCLLLVHQIVVLTNTLPMSRDPTFSLTQATTLSKDVLGVVPCFPLLFNLFLYFTCHHPSHCET